MSTRQRNMGKPSNHQAETAANARKKPYWPTVLRVPWLAMLLVLSLILIACLEVAARQLPMNPGRNYMDKAYQPVETSAQLDRRQVTTSATCTVATTITITSVIPITSGTDFTTITVTNVPAKRDATLAARQPQATGADGCVTTTLTVILPSTAYVALKQTVTETFTAEPTSSTTTSSISSSSSSTSTRLSTSTSTRLSSSTSTRMSTSTSKSNSSRSACLAVVTTVQTVFSGTQLVRRVPQTNVGVDGCLTVTSTIAELYTVFYPTSQTTKQTTPSSQDKPSTSTDSIAQESTATSDVVATSTASSMLLRSYTFKPVLSQTTTNSSGQEQVEVRVIVLTWHHWNIFIGNYLPVLVAVIFKMLWIPVVANANLMRPFLLLSRPGGATAKHTLFTSYLATWNNPFTMWQDEDWLALCAIINLGIATLIGPFASEAIWLDSHYNCPHPQVGSNNPCWPPRLSADPYILRILQGLLSCFAFITIIIIFFTSKVSSPLHESPATLSGIINLVHHPNLLHRLRNVSSNISKQQLKDNLASSGYTLGLSHDQSGQARFGIVPIASSSSAVTVRQSGMRRKFISAISRGFASNSALVLFLSTIFLSLGLLGVVVAYYNDRTLSGFTLFFTSNDFGPTFIMTSTATLVSISFASMQEDVASGAPFHRLKRKPAPAASTLYLSKSSLPVFAIFTFLRHGYLVPALGSLTELLTEVLIVFAAVLPFSPGQVYLEVLISSYVCMSILGLVVVCAIIMVIWRRAVYVPRKPNNIAAVMSYVSGSRLTTLGGIDRSDNQVRYMYMKGMGVDGVERFMIDVVET